jgi:hypothetical protein
MASDPLRSTVGSRARRSANQALERTAARRTFAFQMNKTVSAQVPLALSGGCWLLLEWLFGWGPHARVNSFASLHPYAALFADAVAIASWLVILGGLRFFRRWRDGYLFW